MTLLKKKSKQRIFRKKEEKVLRVGEMVFPKYELPNWLSDTNTYCYVIFCSCSDK